MKADSSTLAGGSEPPQSASFPDSKKRVLAFTLVAALGAACGSRTELFWGDGIAAEDSGSFVGSLDAGSAVDSGARCDACGVQPPNDAGSADTGLPDASDGTDASSVPLSACRGTDSGLVIVDTEDPYFDENLHAFECTPVLGPPSQIYLQIYDSVGDAYWLLTFAAAQDAHTLGVGTYQNADSPPTDGGPQLVVTGEGAGCDVTTGRFQIDALEVDDAGVVRSFGATFEQQCVGAGNAGLTLNGCVYVSR